MAKRPAHPPKALSDQAIKQIVRLNSGEAGNEDWHAFHHWRSQSPEHEAAAREAEALWSDASELHRDPETGIIRPGRKRGGPSRRAVLGGIAGLSAAGAVGLWSQRATLMRPDYATGTGETRTIELTDGSRITLNAASAVDVDYAIGRSVTLLKGQAFFEVAPDISRPFTVNARANRVVSLGTAFDVDMNLPTEGTAVSVTEHAVRVETNVAATGSESYRAIVDEGERLVISAAGRLGDIAPQEASVATAWRTGMYVAEEKRLDEVIAAFSAYHKGWIVIRGERLRALRVNAVLDLRTPEASLDALASGLPITVTHVSTYLTVIAGA